MNTLLHVHIHARVGTLSTLLIYSSSAMDMCVVEGVTVSDCV